MEQDKQVVVDLAGANGIDTLDVLRMLTDREATIVALALNNTFKMVQVEWGRGKAQFLDTILRARAEPM